MILLKDYPEGTRFRTRRGEVVVLRTKFCRPIHAGMVANVTRENGVTEARYGNGSVWGTVESEYDIIGVEQ